MKYSTNKEFCSKIKSEVIEEKDEEPDELNEIMEQLNEVMAIIDKNLIDLSVLTTIERLQNEIHQFNLAKVDRGKLKDSIKSKLVALEALI
jgi:uncharacterized protein YpuA (DUF1002 family)